MQEENQGHVIVLMSVYNGEQYIEEQLKSIYRQSYSGPITVCIRDDGSGDETCAKVRSVEKPENRDYLLWKGKNVGPAQSFLRLIQKVGEADWYFYADQDDVWDADKIKVGVKAMGYSKEPILYGCNYRICDADLNVIRETGIVQEFCLTPLKMFFYNQIPGCCMGMNRCMMDALKAMKLKSVMMHDCMTLSYALFAGTVIYNPLPAVSHRIHDRNVVGLGHKKIVLRAWIRDKYRLLKEKEAYDVCEMASRFLRVTSKPENRPYYKDILLLKNYRKNMRATWKLLAHKDTKDCWYDRTTLSVRSKIFFRLF